MTELYIYTHSHIHTFLCSILILCKITCIYILCVYIDIYIHSLYTYMYILMKYKYTFSQDENGGWNGRMPRLQTFGHPQKSPKPTTKEPYIAAQEPYIPAKEPNNHRGIPAPYMTHTCVMRICVNGRWSCGMP